MSNPNMLYISKFKINDTDYMMGESTGKHSIIHGCYSDYMKELNPLGYFVLKTTPRDQT